LTPTQALAKLKMMFRPKAWSRRAGVTALVLLSLLTGTLALPHAEVDDFACSPVVLSHDETAHIMGAAPDSPTRDAEHCFLCHSLRSVYPAFEKYEQKTGAFRAERMHAAAFAFADRIDWSLVPGRAPPA
jgi:hypothetical protein